MTNLVKFFSFMLNLVKYFFGESNLNLNYNDFFFKRKGVVDDVYKETKVGTNISNNTGFGNDINVHASSYSYSVTHLRILYENGDIFNYEIKGVLGFKIGDVVTLQFLKEKNDSSRGSLFLIFNHKLGNFFNVGYFIHNKPKILPFLFFIILFFLSLYFDFFGFKGNPFLFFAYLILISLFLTFIYNSSRYTNYTYSTLLGVKCFSVSKERYESIMKIIS